MITRIPLWFEQKTSKERRRPSVAPHHMMKDINVGFSFVRKSQKRDTQVLTMQAA